MFSFCGIVCLGGRYKTVLGETIQTDVLFSSSSLCGLEESLFCQTAHRSSAPATSADPGSTSGAWVAYWERNEPLRDVDEVAIPVLSVCARDDPIRGDTQSTIPLELFETNPHFFLLLTERGGHCGFSTQCDRGAVKACGAVASAAVPSSGAGNHGTNWSHKALLEFFRATTDFFATEERAKQLAARRRGLGGGAGSRVFRHRSVSTCKRMPACSHNIHAIYNWQRSYTRWGNLMEVNGLHWCLLIVSGFVTWRTQHVTLSYRVFSLVSLKSFYRVYKRIIQNIKYLLRPSLASICHVHSWCKERERGGVVAESKKRWTSTKKTEQKSACASKLSYIIWQKQCKLHNEPNKTKTDFYPKPQWVFFIPSYVLIPKSSKLWLKAMMLVP